jgi:glycosyltransferase involved in cell wall biosynthesis
MIAACPYVIYHGLVEQRRMYEEVADAVVWLYPCDSLETFCITALEMLALGIFPVTRRYGALSETLADAERSGGAILLEYAHTTDRAIEAYADAVTGVLLARSWEKTRLDLPRHSWSSIADEWIEFMKLA